MSPEGCLSVYYDAITTVDPATQQTHLAKHYLRLHKRGLVASIRAGVKAPFYLGGTIDVIYNNWRGTVSHGATDPVNPRWAMTSSPANDASAGYIQGVKRPADSSKTTNLTSTATTSTRPGAIGAAIRNLRIRFGQRP